jgi:hypothetical protein
MSFKNHKFQNPLMANKASKSLFEAFGADSSSKMFMVEEKLCDINTILTSTGCL